MFRGVGHRGSHRQSPRSPHAPAQSHKPSQAVQAVRSVVRFHRLSRRRRHLGMNARSRRSICQRLAFFFLGNCLPRPSLHTRPGAHHAWDRFADPFGSSVLDAISAPSTITVTATELGRHHIPCLTTLLHPARHLVCPRSPPRPVHRALRRPPRLPRPPTTLRSPSSVADTHVARASTADPKRLDANCQTNSSPPPTIHCPSTRPAIDAAHLTSPASSGMVTVSENHA